MPQVVIENPILNSPFAEPRRHFKFDDDGITDEIVKARRASAYFVPVPPPKKRGKQLALYSEWTKDRIEENRTVNRIRERVAMWRRGKHHGITSTTRSIPGRSALRPSTSQTTWRCVSTSWAAAWWDPVARQG